MERKNNSGQALLVILLIMAVALTVGLAVVSRSITDIRLSQEQEESARAFSVAEAGLESLLVGEVPPSELEGFTIKTTTQNLGGTTGFVFPEQINKGDTQTIWLVSHKDDGTLDSDFRNFSDFKFYWGNKGLGGSSDTDPALEAFIIYKDGNEYKTRRVAFDPKAGRSGGFAGVDVGIFSLEGKDFSFQANFGPVPSGNLYALRIKLLYNNEPQILGIEAVNAELPIQGKCYQSEASSPTTGISRKVQQCQLHKSLPAIFDYVLFSEQDLTHQ